MEHSKAKVEKDTKEPEDPKVDLKMRNNHVIKVRGTGVGTQQTEGDWLKAFLLWPATGSAPRLADPTTDGNTTVTLEAMLR